MKRTTSGILMMGMFLFATIVINRTYFRSVSQSNTSRVSTSVVVSSNTGGNSGGSVSTGDSVSRVVVRNRLNFNFSN